MNGKGHGMHSPFVFQFIVKVLNNGQGYTPPPAVEALRRTMRKDNRALPPNDLGAGSRAGAMEQLVVKRIARTALMPARYSHLLYRMVHHYQPTQILELGTSLGITTAYLALANANAKVYTIEGNPSIRQVAVDNFKQLGVPQIQSVAGAFDDCLPAILQEMKKVDFVLVDGNHRYEPTLKYFQQLLPFCHNDTFLVFDDIHWSSEMERAWEAIKTDPRVRCTIDLFFLGIVLFRSEFRERQDFVIRY
ncbi:hypothetical protein BUE76_16515 [Cnuella takakiae]|nr:hypothetical protein BUE76_16515 [Cnuella takakiae]